MDGDSSASLAQPYECGAERQREIHDIGSGHPCTRAVGGHHSDDETMTSEPAGSVGQFDDLLLGGCHTTITHQGQPQVRRRRSWTQFSPGEEGRESQVSRNSLPCLSTYIDQRTAVVPRMMLARVESLWQRRPAQVALNRRC